MPRRGGDKRTGSGGSEGTYSAGGRGGYYGGGDRFADGGGGGGGGRSFSRGRGRYSGGGDGWGRRGGSRGGHRGYRGGSGGYRGGDQNRKGYKRNQGIHEIDGKRQKMEIGNRLKEVDIGITEFVGDHKGFSGVVKERYGDFHVHEISPAGEIAKLTDQSIPPEPEQLDDMEDLKKQIPSKVWDQLETLIEADSMVTSVDIDVTTMGKDERRAIHVIAKKFPNTVSQTVEKGETKLIVVAKANKQKMSGHKLRRDQRVDWARRGGNYCHFLLHKVNMDTMDALNQMGMYLRIKSNMFNYAGTKDRRARTTQWVSLKKVSPIDILSAGKAVRGAYVGNFKFSEEPLRLGLLNGNRFRIALRSVTGSDEEIEKAMTTLKNNGFINYYGLQRFGTVAAIPTHEIGKALLQGKWHEAIELILKPRAGEQQRDLVEAREIYQKTKDAHAAYQRISRPDKIEAKLLWGLHVCGDKNPQGALDWVPRNTSLMYIHAYQSFIWNLIVSKRIKELGRKPVVGDLVYENPNFKEETDRLDYTHIDNEEETESEKGKDSAERKDEIGKEDSKINDKQESVEVEKSDEVEKVEEELNKEEEKSEDPEKNGKDLHKTEETEENMEATAVIENENNVNNLKEGENQNGEEVKDIANKEKNTTETDKEDLHSLPAVKALTEEDLPNYTLADIVMPQPGWRVTYPAYAKPWFDEVLAKDDLTTDLRQKNRKYTLGGAYRKMLAIPTDISWRIMRYKERYDDLILCDVDEMRGLPEPKEDPEGKHKALIVEMSLRPSTYATMALREILKCDTSPQTQAAQSAANKAQEDEEAKKGLNNKDEQKKTVETENKEDGKEETEKKENEVEEAGLLDTETETETETETKEEKMEVAENVENGDDEKDMKTSGVEMECGENTEDVVTKS